MRQRPARRVGDRRDRADCADRSAIGGPAGPGRDLLGEFCSPLDLLLDPFVVLRKLFGFADPAHLELDAGTQWALPAHCLASSFDDTSSIQNPLNSSLTSVYGPSVTTGGSALKSMTNPSSGAVRPSPASITPALTSSSL